MKKRISFTVLNDNPGTTYHALRRARKDDGVYARTIETLIGELVPTTKYKVEWKLDPTGAYVIQGNKEGGHFPQVHRIGAGHEDWSGLCVFPEEWVGRVVSRRVIKVYP